jgi:hypothetical protein
VFSTVGPKNLKRGGASDVRLASIKTSTTLLWDAKDAQKGSTQIGCGARNARTAQLGIINRHRHKGCAWLASLERSRAKATQRARHVRRAGSKRLRGNVTVRNVTEENSKTRRLERCARAVPVGFSPQALWKWGSRAKCAQEDGSKP